MVFGTYGLWLPNDPRGSWSEFVNAWELFRYGGRATTTSTRRSVAAAPHNRGLRRQTKEHLKYPPVVLTGEQARSVGNGFARMTEKSGYQVFACSIMPEHVHLVLGRFRYKVESMMRLLKAEASIKLQKDGLHPMAQWPLPDGSLHSPWAEHGWKVYLDSIDDIVRAIRYVEDNPLKEGKPRQHWSFITPYIPAPFLRNGAKRE